MSIGSEMKELEQRVHYLEGECQRLAAIISQLVAEKQEPKEVHHHYYYPPPKIFGCPQTPQWQSPEVPSLPKQPNVQC